MAPTTKHPKSTNGTPSKLDPQAKAAKAKAHMQQRMKSNAQRRKKHDDELRGLQGAVDAFDVATRVKTFEELPLSERTQKGESSHFFI